MDSNLVYFVVRNESRVVDNQELHHQHHHHLDWFEIDPKTGELFTRVSHLDREIAEHVLVLVGVEDVNAAEPYRPQIATGIH